MSETSSPVLALGLSRPTRPEPAVPNSVLGMIIFIVTEVMFFSGLISAFIIAKGLHTEATWPPANQPRLPVEETALNSVALLVSGVLIWIAGRQFKKEPAGARRALFYSIGLGSFFVLFQGIEWIQLVRQGMNLAFSTHGSFFYLIVGVHAAHAVIALVAMGWAYRELRAERLTSSAFWTVRLFWYFVVLVWPILYGLVYLS